MNTPIISWYIKENNDYIQDQEYYLGSYNPDSEISLQVQVWNNRYNQSEVSSINDARFVIYFENIEDSILLQYCSVNVNENGFYPPAIELDKGYVSIGKLSGATNDGLDSESNKNNYKNIILKFTNLPKNLRNGLKNMYIDIEY